MEASLVTRRVLARADVRSWAWWQLPWLLKCYVGLVPLVAAALTGLAGKLVAEAVAGTAERFDVFARIPHRDFPGGPVLRRPSLILAMLYYRLRDLL